MQRVGEISGEFMKSLAGKIEDPVFLQQQELKERLHAIRICQRNSDAAWAALPDWGVPLRVRDALADVHVVDGGRTNHQLQAVMRWMHTKDRSRNILVLSSGKGTGKSVAAAFWLLHCAYGNSQLGGKRWVSAAAMSMMSTREGAHEIYAHIPQLVIDDLSAEYSDHKGYFQTILDWLLDQRHGNYRDTIITTNLNSKDFSKRYGERIYDRLRESSVWVSSNDPSYRGRK